MAAPATSLGNASLGERTLLLRVDVVKHILDD